MNNPSLLPRTTFIRGALLVAGAGIVVGCSVAADNDAQHAPLSGAAASAAHEVVVGDPRQGGPIVQGQHVLPAPKGVAGR